MDETPDPRAISSGGLMFGFQMGLHLLESTVPCAPRRPAGGKALQSAVRSTQLATRIPLDS